MNLDKFNDWPSDKATKRLIYLGFIILWILWPFFIIIVTMANYPVSFLESQLSFSGAVIKSHFKEMTAEELLYYRLYQVCDIIYDFCHIIMFFGLSLFLARKFAEDSDWRKTGFLMAILGILGSISDIIENCFIIMMTTDPQGFPDIWAVTHSCLATIKFTLWGIQAVWIIWADIKLLRKEEISIKQFLAVLGVGFSHWWPTPLTALEILLGIA